MTRLNAGRSDQGFAARPGNSGEARTATRWRRAEVKTRTEAFRCYNLIMDDGHVLRFDSTRPIGFQWSFQVDPAISAGKRTRRVDRTFLSGQDLSDVYFSWSFPKQRCVAQSLGTSTDRGIE